MQLPFRVSRETSTRLEEYLALLLEWNSHINLVGHSTTQSALSRHITDSAQLLRFLPEKSVTIADLGSGAGLPGMIIAILSSHQVHLIESDKRKVAFLREASRLTGASVTIHNKRIEDIPNLKADVVTARALAPLHLLLELAEPFLHSNSFCLFPKGENYITELEDIKGWTYERVLHPSQAHPGSVVLQISHLQREL
jgi:16S rRNA (guanine527-N7)-methyltransferase